MPPKKGSKSSQRAYEELNRAFQGLVANLKPPEPKPPKTTPRELASVLGAIAALDGPPTHEQIYEEMAREGWAKEEAHKARYRVAGAGYIETVRVTLTGKGKDQQEKTQIQDDAATGA